MEPLRGDRYLPGAVLATGAPVGQYIHRDPKIKLGKNR